VHGLLLEHQVQTNLTERHTGIYGTFLTDLLNALCIYSMVPLKFNYTILIQLQNMLCIKYKLKLKLAD